MEDCVMPIWKFIFCGVHEGTKWILYKDLCEWGDIIVQKVLESVWMPLCCKAKVVSRGKY